MNTTTLSKTDFIKFNVSPTFKALAQKKARANGMTLSELGRMLFGAFVTKISHKKNFSPQFLALAEEAKRDYKNGKTLSFSSKEELLRYLDDSK